MATHIQALPRWRRGAAVGLAAAALVLGACGIKEEAAAGGDFCEQARVLSETGPELPDSPEGIRQAADQFDRLAASAPSEIEEDMDLLADVFGQVAEALAESGGDSPEDVFAAAAPFFDPENAERLEAASDNIEQYTRDECGFELDQTTDTTGDDTTTSASTTSTTEEETTSTTEDDDGSTTTTEDDTTSTTGGGGDALPPGEPPGDLGDDPALDALAESCFEGEMQACDDLYFQSPIDSAYEDYGDSCGGRNEPMGLCTELYPEA